MHLFGFFLWTFNPVGSRTWTVVLLSLQAKRQARGLRNRSLLLTLHDGRFTLTGYTYICQPCLRSVPLNICDIDWELSICQAYSDHYSVTRTTLANVYDCRWGLVPVHFLILYFIYWVVVLLTYQHSSFLPLIVVWPKFTVRRGDRDAGVKHSLRHVSTSNSFTVVLRGIISEPCFN